MASDKPDKVRLEWMYTGDKHDPEEYLLGRRVDESSLAQLRSGNSRSGKPACGFTVDVANKIREDPLFQMKKQELEERRRILDNPVRLREIKRKEVWVERTDFGGDRESSSRIHRREKLWSDRRERSRNDRRERSRNYRRERSRSSRRERSRSDRQESLRNDRRERSRNDRRERSRNDRRERSRSSRRERSRSDRQESLGNDRRERSRSGQWERLKSDRREISRDDQREGSSRHGPERRIDPSRYETKSLSREISSPHPREKQSERRSEKSADLRLEEMVANAGWHKAQRKERIDRHHEKIKGEEQDDRTKEGIGLSILRDSYKSVGDRIARNPKRFHHKD